MVATSIAARGLDVKDLNLVVNYTAPNHMEDYVHRVGRTGRAGNKGTAYTFVSPNEERNASQIALALEWSSAVVPPELAKLVNQYKLKRPNNNANAGVSFGYNTSGFKFDENEEQAFRDKKHQLKIEAGIEEEPINEVSMFDDESEDLQPTISPIEQAQKVLNNNSFTSLKDKFQALANSMVKNTEGVENLVINSYPKAARSRVTTKATIDSIRELTSCAITVKGTFVPAGRKPKPGEQELYLMIEGPNMSAVKIAKTELTRILQEVAATCPPDNDVYTKYSPL